MRTREEAESSKNLRTLMQFSFVNYLRSILNGYNHTHKFPLTSIQNCNNLRFLIYVLTFSTLEHNEIKIDSNI